MGGVTAPAFYEKFDNFEKFLYTMHSEIFQEACAVVQSNKVYAKLYNVIDKLLKRCYNDISFKSIMKGVRR